MQIEEHGPGFMHYPLHFEFDWFQQLTAEKPVEQRDKYGNKKRWWVPKKSGARNEAIDLTVYSYAVLHYVNPDWHKLAAELAKPVITAEQVAQKKRPTQIETESSNEQRSRPSWFRR